MPLIYPDLELTTPTEDKIMPYHVSPGGQVDVSQRKYNGALASRKELTNRVEELLMQFMQISTRNKRRRGNKIEPWKMQGTGSSAKA